MEDKDLVTPVEGAQDTEESEGTAGPAGWTELETVAPGQEVAATVSAPDEAGDGDPEEDEE